MEIIGFILNLQNAAAEVSQAEPVVVGRNGESKRLMGIPYGYREVSMHAYDRMHYHAFNERQEFGRGDRIVVVGPELASTLNKIHHEEVKKLMSDLTYLPNGYAYTIVKPGQNSLYNNTALTNKLSLDFFKGIQGAGGADVEDSQLAIAAIKGLGAVPHDKVNLQEALLSTFVLARARERKAQGQR